MGDREREIVPAPHQEITVESGEYMRQRSAFEHLQRVGKLFAESQLVPDRFRGKIADCAIILQMAWRHDADPMMFFNGVYIVHGTPAFEAKLAIALVNSRGVFTGPIQYEYSGSGETRACRAFASSARGGALCEATVDMRMAQAEGWTANKKWLSMPDVMLAYRSAAFLIRRYAPDCLYGMRTADEIEDERARSVDVTVLDSASQEIKQRLADTIAAGQSVALPAAQPTAAPVEVPQRAQ
ncbi:MAG: hypothetical protein ABIF82_09940, partial [Planctomycetota bacterium]